MAREEKFRRELRYPIGSASFMSPSRVLILQEIREPIRPGESFWPSRILTVFLTYTGWQTRRNVLIGLPVTLWEGEFKYFRMMNRILMVICMKELAHFRSIRMYPRGKELPQICL